MALPADIALIKHPWQRNAGDEWTSAAFRSPVIVWLDGALTALAWASSISVVEKFHRAGIHRRMPYGPSHYAEPPRTIETGFRQSDAIPVLVFTAIRAADREEFKVSIPFTRGALTDVPTVDFYLGQALGALTAEEARRPLL